MSILPQRTFTSWVVERLPIDSVVRHFSRKEVPQHKQSLWYYLGGLALLFLVVQFVTGILLALHYEPSPDHSNESIVRIINQIPHGWLIRSLHSWSADFLIATMVVHMFAVFFLRAYRKPRELMWFSGMIMLLLVLGFAFTGALLPWDTVAYYATMIGTTVPQSVPLVGTWIVGLLKGAEEIGSETLARMYAIHIIVLPLFSIVTVTCHLVLNQYYGVSVPIGVKESRPPLKFFPNFLMKDLIAWSIGLIALIGCATMLPPGIGEKANPLASAPTGIRPAWYFLTLFESLKLMPASVAGLDGELVVNVLVAAGLTAWFAIPVLDRSASRGEKKKLSALIGVCVALYLVGTTGLALWGPGENGAAGNGHGAVRFPDFSIRLMIAVVSGLLLGVFVLIVNAWQRQIAAKEGQKDVH